MQNHILQQLMERLVRAGLRETAAKETIDNLLTVYSLSHDCDELLQEVEELAALLEEDCLVEDNGQKRASRPFLHR